MQWSRGIFINYYKEISPLAVAWSKWRSLLFLVRVVNGWALARHPGRNAMKPGDINAA